jgi:hexosaminidase
MAERFDPDQHETGMQGSRTRHPLNSERPFLRLDCDWTRTADGRGVLTLKLSNSSARCSFANFRLAFTSLFPLVVDGQLSGARLVDQMSNYHVIAPPKGFVLASGTSWSVSAELSHRLRHYTSAVKSAYLIRNDGGLVPIEAAPTTYSHGAGAPRLEPFWALPTLSGRPPGVAVLPFPCTVQVAGQRHATSALHLAGGAPQAQSGFEAAAALAKRLFPADPPLFAPTNGIACEARHAEIPAEAYRIDFADRVTVHASGQAGFFYGLITLAQMLHAARRVPDQFAFPSRGEIVDAPRFAWRGMLLDVARQVFSPEDLLRVLDCLAWQKLNRFHLHLTDDEGWRLEIPGYPQLTERGGWRGHGLALPPLLGSPAERYGIVYSRSALAELARRAEELAITLVPEIEMPGHCYAMLQAMPELRDPGDAGGHRNVLNPAVSKTYEVLEAVFGEVASLFSSPWIHIGADEVPGDAWLASPLAKAFMQERGWQANYQLQSYFLRRVQEIIRRLARRTGAWEEAALEGGIDPRDSYLAAWRASAKGVALAAQGYDIVLAPGEAYYLDMAQSEDWWDPGMDWAGTVSPERCYAYEPGGDWPDELKPHLLGVQACLWSEHLHDRSLFDVLVFPRLCAVAESAWTRSSAKDFRRFAALSGLIPRPGVR